VNRTGSTVSRLIANQGLLLLTIVLIIVFSLVLPNTFPSLLTAQSILSDRSTIAFLALAEMIVISAGQFDSRSVTASASRISSPSACK
jgi:ribose transport system permease protein